jgi:NADH-quinone oxidoreductase subunit J
MLLDLGAEERRKMKILAIVGGMTSAGAILIMFLRSLLSAPLGATDSPTVEGGTLDLGRLLFTQYVLPFEIVSVLLLVAMVGVVLLSKKDLK